MSDNKVNSSSGSIILESDLKSFFYKELEALNRCAINPLPLETIFYSSNVMDNFSVSERYFDIQSGKVKNKILGIKLLESSQLSSEAQKRELRDIGDSALLLCGVFSESLNRKIVDLNFYESLGAVAYGRLNAFIPNELEIDGFYLTLAENFKCLANMMSAATSTFLNNSEDDSWALDSLKNFKINPT